MSRLPDLIRASVSTGLSTHDTLLPIEARGAISGGYHVCDACLPLPAAGNIYDRCVLWHRGFPHCLT
jgi:hypothetical protein